MKKARNQLGEAEWALTKDVLNALMYQAGNTSQFYYVSGLKDWLTADRFLGIPWLNRQYGDDLVDGIPDYFQ